MALQAEKRNGPLSGLKVLDFTQAYAGPYAAMLLADMGATVIKVEEPGGEHIRDFGPYLHPEYKDMGLGGYFSSVNRNKQSICLNLKDPAAQKVAQQLAAECDAMLMNFSSPRIMKKFHLDYDTIKEINPKLVYVAISGYGTNTVVPSLYEGKPTIDLMMQAESGTLSVTGDAQGNMYKVGPGIGDTYPGTLSVVGLLAALVNAKETGQGQYVDVAMLDSMILLSERIIYQYAYTGKSPRPMGNRHPLQAPYSVYPTKDGHIVIAASPPRYWERLVEALDIPELRTERFATKEKRIPIADEVDAIVTRWTTAHTNKEAMEILNAHECLAAPVSRAGDLFTNEHVAKREMIVEVEGDPKTKEKVRIVGSPLKFSRTRAEVYRRAPLAGENSVGLLKQLGYDDKAIDSLLSSGAVQGTTL